MKDKCNAVSNKLFDVNFEMEALYDTNICHNEKNELKVVEQEKRNECNKKFANIAAFAIMSAAALSNVSVGLSVGLSDDCVLVVSKT